jgi:hypothetical protein
VCINLTFSRWGPVFQFHGVRICRHGFYYMVVLTEDFRLRRKGKPLRNYLMILKGNSFGMQGRLLPFQKTPFEVLSNFGGTTTWRSNLDLQDMRRVLPESMWLPEGETLPHLGDQPDWGHMNKYEWTGEAYEEKPNLEGQDPHMWTDFVTASEWREMLLDLHRQHQKPAAPDGGQSAATDPLLSELSGYAHAAFADGINTGFYVNCYTTKQCPTMEGLLQELQKGIRRLEEQREADETQRAKAAECATETGLSESASAEANRRKSSFSTALQTLGRLNSSYRRCHWKSGSELVFPILFEHLTFASHRTWKVYIKKAVFMASEAWRRLYGSSVLHARSKHQQPDGEVLLYKRDGLEDYVLRGWQRIQVSESCVLYKGPEGQVCQSLLDAFEHDQASKQKGGDACRRLSALQEFLRGACQAKDKAPPRPVPSGGGSKPTPLMRGTEAGEDEPVPEPSLQDQQLKERRVLVTTSTLEDYLFRGSHPVLAGMSFFVYAMWVYRVEKPPREEASVRSALVKNFDMPFAEAYKLSSTHLQRISTELRVPMFEGFLMPAATVDSETASMFKQLLCRPFHIDEGLVASVSEEDLVLRSFQSFCAPPRTAQEDMSAWAATAFTRCYVQWSKNNETLAREARFRFLARYEYPSLWETSEVQVAMEHLADEMEKEEEREARAVYETTLWPDPDAEKPRASVAHYSALVGADVELNLEGLARARLEKHSKRRDLDAKVGEEYIRVHAPGTSAADADEEGPPEETGGDDMAKAPAHTFPLVPHKPSLEDMQKLLEFKMRSRVSKFGKDLQSLPFMATAAATATATDVSGASTTYKQRVEGLLKSFQGFKHLSSVDKQDIMGLHQEHMGKKSAGSRAEDDLTQEISLDSLRKLLPDIPVGSSRFSDQGLYAKPSDLVVAMVKNLPRKKQLTEDQTLFMARFADICDKIYDQQAKPPEERHVYHMLLLGQGGSGKTFVVQELVFVALHYIWPPQEGETLHVVAASNAQAKNISTPEIKARTLHTAGCLGVQKMTKARLGPGQKAQKLQSRWRHAVALVIEEISMVAAMLYHMLDYRSMLGRAAEFNVSDSTYSKPGHAFGRIPLVLHLGDFLQLKPTANISLVDDLQAANEDGSYKFENPAIEIQHAQKVFRAIENVFELRGTRRFVAGDPLIEFLQCMRRGPDPATGKTFPDQVWAAFEQTWATDKDDVLDPRHQEARFQEGYGMGIYWETLARWIPKRAQLDARKLGKPLVFLQCVDEAGGMDDATAWRFLNQFNIYNTGKMHGVLPVHEGMRLRLTEKVDADMGLVQEAVGTVIEIVFHPADQAVYENMPAGSIFRPDHLPAGIWLRMDGYNKCPTWEEFLPHVQVPVGELSLNSLSAPKHRSAEDDSEFSEITAFCHASGVCPQPNADDSQEKQLAVALARITADGKLGHCDVETLREACQHGQNVKAAKSMFFLPAMETQVDFSSTDKYTIRRCGFQASHAQFLTSTASQGQTLRAGVTIDCARVPKQGNKREGMDDDTWWLHLYVMFSRATRVFAVPTNSFGFLFARFLKDCCSQARK